MSILAIVYSVVTTAASLILDYKRRKKIHNLLAGQQQWRESCIQNREESKSHYLQLHEFKGQLAKVANEKKLNEGKHVLLASAYARLDAELTRTRAELLKLQQEYLQLQREGMEQLEKIRAAWKLNS